MTEINDLMLATAYKYRYLPTIANSTSTGAHKKALTAAFDPVSITQPSLCTTINFADGNHWHKPVDKAGVLRTTSSKDPNPSPLAAVEWLLKNDKQINLDSPIREAPWPILMKLATAQVPSA